MARFAPLTGLLGAAALAATAGAAPAPGQGLDIRTLFSAPSANTAGTPAPAAATLACIGRRQDYFREEFLSALEILARGDVKADHLKGSWAGAFGPTQFMPTSFKRYAVDFDGRRDVVDSVPDVIASTANNLKK